MPYCPPEIIDGQDKHYNPFKADVFSLGVVLFLLNTSVMPFHPFDQKREKLQPSALIASRKLSLDLKLLL